MSKDDQLLSCSVLITDEERIRQDYDKMCKYKQEAVRRQMGNELLNYIEVGAYYQIQLRYDYHPHRFGHIIEYSIPVRRLPYDDRCYR